MKSTLQALGTVLLSTVGLVLAADIAAAAEEATNICLRSGMRIRAARIETQDGKYQFYPIGASTPINEDAANVRCIGCNDCGGQPVKFSIAGSNTIGEALLPAIIREYGKKAHGVPPLFIPVPGEQEAQTIKLGSPDEPVATIDFTARGSGTAPKALMEKMGYSAGVSLATWYCASG